MRDLHVKINDDAFSELMRYIQSKNTTIKDALERAIKLLIEESDFIEKAYEKIMSSDYEEAQKKKLLRYYMELNRMKALTKQAKKELDDIAAKLEAFNAYQVQVEIHDALRTISENISLLRYLAETKIFDYETINELERNIKRFNVLFEKLKAIVITAKKSQ